MDEIDKNSEEFKNEKIREINEDYGIKTTLQQIVDTANGLLTNDGNSTEMSRCIYQSMHEKLQEMVIDEISKLSNYDTPKALCDYLIGNSKVPVQLYATGPESDATFYPTVGHRRIADRVDDDAFNNIPQPITRATSDAAEVIGSLGL